MSIESREGLRIKKRIAQHFSQASATYDGAAGFQLAVMGDLFTLLDADATSYQHILDLGCGTGAGMRQLIVRHPQAHLLGLDLALGMLKQAQRGGAVGSPSLQGASISDPEKSHSVCLPSEAGDPFLILGSHFRENDSDLASRSGQNDFSGEQEHAYLQADFDHLPIQAGWAQLIFSNLALQWSLNLPRSLAEIKKALAPGGSLVFSTLQAGSLGELNASFQELGFPGRVNSFLSAEEVRTILEVQGFQLEHFIEKKYEQYYESVSALMRSLKKVGANVVLREDSGAALKQSDFKMLEAIYPTDALGVKVSYAVLLIVAREALHESD